MTAPKFKAGDVVKCINGGPYQYSGQLTNSKHYEVKRGYIDGGNDTVDFTDDKGAAASAFASRFILVPSDIQAGDVVRCDNPGVYNLTKGRFYLVRGTHIHGTDRFVTVTDDTGGRASAFARRFTFRSKSSPINRPPTTAEVEKARAERKATEAARKEKGKARAAAQGAYTATFRDVTIPNEKVNELVETYLRSLGIKQKVAKVVRTDIKFTSVIFE